MRAPKPARRRGSRDSLPDVQVLAPARRRREYAEPELPDDARDAKRWRALLSSKRMRVSTTVHQPHSNPVPGSKYINVEFWSASYIETTAVAREALIRYVDYIISTKGE